MKKLVFLLICLFPVLAIQAEIITVDDTGSANFNNIQNAIDNSQNGDIIVVAPGTYNENIHFNNRAVTLTGTDPEDPNIIEATIIYADTGNSISFDFGEGSDSVVTGFTITGQGIYCYGTSPTITKNIIRDCQGNGIYGENNATPVISENTITSSGLQGIYYCHGPITNNLITKNNGGIGYCDGPITNNAIIENNDRRFGRGGGLSFCDGEVSNNTIANNYAAYKGGGCYECDGNVTGNIITGNSSVISGGGLSDCHGFVRNNIISGNKCGVGGGLFSCTNVINNTIIGNLAYETGGAISQCPGYVINNIMAFNRANLVGGIYGSSVNSYNAFWSNEGGNFGGGAIVRTGDVIVNPSFALDGYWDPNGTTDDTSDDFWVDGDYHLKSTTGRWDPENLRWATDNLNSRCIDAGDPNTDWTKELWPHGKNINIGAYGGTHEASMSVSNIGNIADLNIQIDDANDWVDYRDLLLFTQKWLSDETLLTEDLDRNGIVDFMDFAILVNNWQPQPPAPLPPLPNPMTWATVPYATSTSAISMSATTAVTSDNSGVEYYFDCLTAGGHDSGWQNGTNYTDTNLAPNAQYTYRVKARNKVNLVETDYSVNRSATTLPEDNTAPQPNPARWDTEPYASSSDSIRMVAATATDDSGVEYYFQCTSNSQYSSGWQDSPVYEARNLSEGIYSFVTRSRDKSANHNTTANSTEITIDLSPPSPNPMQWAVNGEPMEIYGGGGTWDYWAVMEAVEATDANGGVQYYFQCTTESGLSSGWQDSPEYEVRVGRRGQGHVFRVKARDVYGNQTAYSPALPAN